MLMARLLIAFALAAAGATAGAAELTLARCDKPIYTSELLRYRVEGSTTLLFSRSPSGRPENAIVKQSSGWKLLDEESLKLIASCRFERPPEDHDTDTLVVPWVMPPVPNAPPAPALAAGGCPASPVLRVAGEGEAGAVKARILVWNDGKVYSPRMNSSGDAATDRLMLEFIHTCRYSPAMQDGVAVAAPATIAVALSEDASSDQALRVVYDRLLPMMEKLAARDKQYKVAHILLATEGEALAILASLKGGASFSQQAALRSLDRKGQDGGNLGWAVVTNYVAPIAAVLKASTAEGLHDGVIQSSAGWHVLRIDGVKAQVVPAFDSSRTTLRKWIIDGSLERIEANMKKKLNL